MQFSSEFLIRFSHCDPAGIVYFANFFDMINGLIEDWFANALDTPFHDLHLKRRWGFPVVETQCEFASPCQLGDRLVMELSVVDLGRSSVALAIRGRVGDQEKLRARHKVAMISLASFRSVALPDDLRTRMESYLEDPAAPS